MNRDVELPLSSVGVRTVADGTRTLDALVVAVFVAAHPFADSSRSVDLLLLGGTEARHSAPLPEVLGVGAFRCLEPTLVLRADAVALSARTLLGFVVTSSVALRIAESRAS